VATAPLARLARAHERRPPHAPRLTGAGRQVVAALAGGAVELGDRVACLRSGGAPAFGARGTARPSP